MNLYSITSPGVKSIVTDQSGSLVEYSAAESATALPVTQFPNAAISPEILIVSPYVVVTVSSNVTAIEVAVVQETEVVVLVVIVLEDLVVVEESPNPAASQSQSWQRPLKR
jgi:hypothetical protein